MLAGWGGYSHRIPAQSGAVIKPSGGCNQVATDNNRVAGQLFESDNGFIGTSCNLYTAGSTIPDGFGVPWNVFNPTQLLLKASCTSSSVTADIGPATYVYHQGYSWDGTKWTQLAFTCTGGAKVSQVWCPNTAEAPLPTNTTFYAAYTCNFVNNAWKCGCRDQACTTNYWQLQKIQR